MAPSRHRTAPQRTDRPPARKSSPSHHFTLGDPLVKMLVAAFLITGIVLLAVFAFFYVKYEGIVDRRMSGQIFNNAAKIYARPEPIEVGQKTSEQEIIAYLRRAGYSEESEENDTPLGHFRLTGSSLEVMPGEESFHAQETATIRFDAGKISSITLKERGGQSLSSYELEPEMITSPSAAKTAPSARSSPSIRSRKTSSTLSLPLKTGASSSTAASTITASCKPA